MLKKRCAVLLFVALAQISCASQLVVLTRHAEKVDESANPLLSQAGQERAERLALLLASFPISKIFVSEMQRTQQTAQPLAQRLSLQPVVIAVGQQPQLLERINALPKRDVALVVGHSNTLPSILADLGVPKPQQPIRVEYGDLFIVIRHFGAPPSLLLLHY